MKSLKTKPEAHKNPLSTKTKSMEYNNIQVAHEEAGFGLGGKEIYILFKKYTVLFLKYRENILFGDSAKYMLL